MDVRQSETRYVKLLRNCSRAALVTESPYVDVRFRGDCSSEFVRVTHLGFHQPREIILEFVVELRNVSLLSLKVNVHENPRLKSLFKKSPKLPTLKPNQTLSKVLNLSGCEARVRRNTRKVPLLGLCGDDPYLWRSCRDILDVFTDSAEPDDVVLAVKLVDYDELNIAIAFSPSTSPPDLAFSSLLRVQVIPRVLSAVRRQVLSTEDRDSFFRTVQLPASCTFVRALTQTKVTQFAQQDIDDLSIALFCRKTAHDAMVQLELVNMLGQTSEPFFVTLSTPVDIGFSYNGLVLTGMKSAAQLEVTSSRDGEIRVLDGLRRGILLADGSPVDSFGTNMSLDYSVHGISTDISRTITTDNLVLDFCSLHFVVPVLLVPYEEPRFQLNPVRVVPGRQVVLSPKHVQFNSIHIGDFEFVLAGHPDGGRLTVNSIAVNNFSSSALLDLKVSFQAFRNASNSETLTLFYAVPGGEFPEVASLAIDFIAPKEDRTAPQPFDCSLQLVAHPRNVRVPLEKGNLRFIDDGDTSCAREVTYNVTSKNSALNGYLGDANGQQISSFTQGDINQGSVFYFPPNIFRRVGGQKTAFEFRVSDAMGNTGPTNCLQVYLEALKISKTVSKQIVCRQDVAFGAELLSSGYNSSSTKFGVTALPKSGRLVKTKDDVKEDLVVGDSFTQSDLLAGYISYHSLFMPTSDTFELLAVNSKDHVLRKRKVRRLRLKRRKFKRNALQYFKVVVNLRSDDHMTGTEGRQELSIELLVDEGRKSNIVQDGSNFTLMTPPRHGQVFIATERNDKAQITYVHSGDEIGFEEQKDKFVVGHSKGVAEVYVRITPVDNLAPVIDAAGSYKVKEAASVSLTIKISDADSKAAWCHITDPPSYGRVTVDRLGPLGLINDTFTEHILYQQTVHSFVEPTDDQFALTCSDGINISRPTFINISVIPQNDEIPSLKVNNVTVIEGREAPIKLTASDGDLPPDELNFRISHLPSHGVVGLLQPNGNVEPIVSFSEHNLTLLFYAHDDSDNLRDSFEVVVSDGVHSMRQKVEVNVLAIDDEAPVLVANRGLQVLIGRAAKITPLDLQVADADSDPGSVRVYIVKQPRHGAVWRTDSISNRNQTAIASFSYQDLVLGLISYVHTSVVCCSDDEFLFSLTDGFNESPSYVFNVSVIRPPTADKSTNISYQTLSTTLINCSQRLPELNADSADI
ncbi:FRAS1-related extracellular matrix protein 2-like, partial [Tropilaelaps mercedesae]